MSDYYNTATHHAEGLVYPKVRAQKKVTDFGYPRAKKTVSILFHNLVKM
jgi:hypothetical protein